MDFGNATRRVPRGPGNTVQKAPQEPSHDTRLILELVQHETFQTIILRNLLMRRQAILLKLETAKIEEVPALQQEAQFLHRLITHPAEVFGA